MPNMEQERAGVAPAYVSDLQSRCREGLARLHKDVEEIVLTDFPDHENVGDSLITLGQVAFWNEVGIRLRSIHSRRTLGRDVLSNGTAIAIQGGGNIGGLYPHHANHRFRLSESLEPGTLLIQEPQTIRFANEAEREKFRTRFAERPRTRLAVRDRESLREVEEIFPETILVPDSAHMLGWINSPAPTQKSVFLLRADAESTDARGRASGSIDWPRWSFGEKVMIQSRRALVEGAITLRHNRRTGSWLKDARDRMATGVALLAPGETIVTDRLHAMILALHLGRNVIAIDNSTGKLSSYAECWFSNSGAPVTFVRDVGEAEALLR